MDYGPISFLSQLPQESPHLPLRNADLLGRCFCVINFFLAFFKATSRSRSA
jgi:hypothetical protein